MADSKEWTVLASRKGRPQSVTFGYNRHEGVEVSYVKGRRDLSVVAWYDSGVGIGPFQLSLAEFLTSLGVTLKDCEKAFAEEKA